VAAIPGEEVPAALSCLLIMKHASGGSYSPLSGTNRKRVRNFSRDIVNENAFAVRFQANEKLADLAAPGESVLRRRQMKPE
jgi:hypothetical protein